MRSRLFISLMVGFLFGFIFFAFVCNSPRADPGGGCHDAEIGNSPRIGFVTELGDDHAYHPKVVALSHPLNGFKYWCAFTPYELGDSSRENPCINASNNLIDWEVPSGLTLPIDRPQTPDSQHYNSDTHLLFDENSGALELFWRYVDDVAGDVTIYRSITHDGIAWSEKERFLYSVNRKEQDYVSPVVMKANGVYQIWYVHRKAVWYGELNEGTSELTVRNPRKMIFPYAGKLFTWHLDIERGHDGELKVVVVACKDVKDRGYMKLYYTQSRDNLTWTIPEVIALPSTRVGAWDCKGLYRSSILEEGGKTYVFYSGHDGENVWHWLAGRTVGMEP